MKEKVNEVIGLFKTHKILIVTHIAAALLFFTFVYTVIIRPKDSKQVIKDTCQTELVSYERALYAYEMRHETKAAEVSLSFTKLNCYETYKAYGEPLEKRFEVVAKMRHAQEDKALKLQMEIDAFAKVERQLGNMVAMEIIRNCK